MPKPCFSDRQSSRAARGFAFVLGVVLLTAVDACSLLAPGDDELLGGLASTAGKDGGEQPQHESDGQSDPTSDGHGETRDGQGDSDRQGDANLSADGDADGVTACETSAATCYAGQTDSQTEKCPCNAPPRSRTRDCVPETCTWGEWGAWSACPAVTMACTPGQTEMGMQNCGLCNTGKQSRSRACTASCAWEEWGVWTTCSGVTAQCQPDHWRCCRPGAWEWCRASTCMYSGDCDATSCANSPYCTC